MSRSVRCPVGKYSGHAAISRASLRHPEVSAAYLESYLTLGQHSEGW